MTTYQEKSILQSLRENNPDIPLLKLKKSFYQFGKPSDEKTLRAVVDDARNSSDLGCLVNKEFR